MAAKCRLTVYHCAVTATRGTSMAAVQSFGVLYIEQNQYLRRCHGCYPALSALARSGLRFPVLRMPARRSAFLSTGRKLFMSTYVSCASRTSHLSVHMQG